MINPITFLTISADSEALRQIEVLENGQSVAQETRGFDEDTASTFKLRSKEDAPEYRYMPDPNLPPLVLTEVSQSSSTLSPSSYSPCF